LHRINENETRKQMINSQFEQAGWYLCNHSSTLEYLLSVFAGVVARVESLPLAAERLRESERQVEGLFESLLVQSFQE